jgi:precorrin-4 methylase
MKSRPYGKRSVAFLVALLVSVPVAFGQRPATADHGPTTLYLVGVGPGDPDLITLRAIGVIKQSDVIFCTDGIETKFASYLQGKEVVTGYWRLFSYYGADPSQLNEPERREADQIAARRKQFIAKVRQAAASGKTIAILDHGDPLIYGPWAWCLEEFEDLHPVVVPGLSSFNAANAALGQGITNSRRTKSVILTATDWPGKTDTIERLSAHGCTMVLFTMRAEFADFIKKLAVNYSPETPIAVVKYAGYQGRQEVIRGTVGTILTQVAQEQLPFEYLIYVGEFLNYRHKQSTPAPAAGKAAAAR